MFEIIVQTLRIVRARRVEWHHKETELHILRGHWPKPLPWPLTLGHELAGVIEEKWPVLKSDFMEQPQLR